MNREELSRRLSQADAECTVAERHIKELESLIAKMNQQGFDTAIQKWQLESLRQDLQRREDDREQIRSQIEQLVRYP